MSLAVRYKGFRISVLGYRQATNRRGFQCAAVLLEDPRLKDFGQVFEDEYGYIRDAYEKPKHAIVLAHGLLGFGELRLAGSMLPGIQYWRGIKEAFNAKGIEVFIPTVPASGSIEARAVQLSQAIQQNMQGKAVNIIAGLDARFMISRLKVPGVEVKSLTTIATPHRGSAFADYMFERIGPINIPKLYKVLEHFGLETGAFSQLTMKYMREQFNPGTPNVDGVRYFSYGASLQPTSWSVFRLSFHIINQVEHAPNDGLVSVPSSKWGEYKGTLVGVSHLDLINWTNRLKWYLWELTGNKHNFNGIAFYLGITDMLAKEGL